MPTYEYRCRACGDELEVVQSFTDDALTTCEACGGALRKVFGSVGISFKGTGFYKNDSRGKRTTPAAAAEAAGTDKGAGEAKPAASDTGGSSTKDAKSSGSTGNGNGTGKGSGTGTGKGKGGDSKPAPSSPAPTPAAT